MAAPRGGHHPRELGSCRAQLTQGAGSGCGPGRPGSPVQAPARRETTGPGHLLGNGRPRRPLRNPAPARRAPARQRRATAGSPSISTQRESSAAGSASRERGTGGGERGCFPPSPRPRPPGALGGRDETLRVPPTPREPGEFKPGASPPAPTVNSSRGGRAHLPPRPRRPRLPLAHLLASPPFLPGAPAPALTFVFRILGSPVSLPHSIPFRVLCRIPV